MAPAPRIAKLVPEAGSDAYGELSRMGAKTLEGKNDHHPADLGIVRREVNCDGYRAPDAWSRTTFALVWKKLLRQTA